MPRVNRRRLTSTVDPCDMVDSLHMRLLGWCFVLGSVVCWSSTSVHVREFGAAVFAILFVFIRSFQVRASDVPHWFLQFSVALLCGMLLIAVFALIPAGSPFIPSMVLSTIAIVFVGSWVVAGVIADMTSLGSTKTVEPTGTSTDR